jgi:hypothetical protein
MRKIAKEKKKNLIIVSNDQRKIFSFINKIRLAYTPQI